MSLELIVKMQRVEIERLEQEIIVLKETIGEMKRDLEKTETPRTLDDWMK